MQVTQQLDSRKDYRITDQTKMLGTFVGQSVAIALTLLACDLAVAIMRSLLPGNKAL